MANKFIDQVGGVMTLRLSGRNPEKLLNMAMSRGVFIWDIKKEPDSLCLKIRNSSFEAFQTLADEHGYEIMLLDQKGMPFYKTVLKRRMGFIGGLIVFILALYLMSSYLWFIQVSGNKQIQSSLILRTAAQHGVYQGAAKWRFNRNEVEKAMLREISQLSYVQLDIRGVKVNIKVVEKILPDESATGPCHIVALRDGVIEDILVLEGQVNVKKGQVVGKGDILISGIVFPPIPYILQGMELDEVPEAYKVRARGKVMAITWYEGYGESCLKTQRTLFTGEEKTTVVLETPWKSYTLRGGEESYALFKEFNRNKNIQTPLGEFAVQRRTLKEQTVQTTVLSQEKAVEIARKKALDQLHQKMKKPIPILDSSVDILSSPSDPIVRLKISVEVMEDISKPQALETIEK